jgi:copper oxidase (laccase) domain-containing protein
MYNYYEAMKEDIKTALKYDYEINTGKDLYELQEELYDEFWCWDSITGNGSGSYTFNNAEAEKYVKDNMELCRESLKEFCVEPDTVAERFLDGDFEYFDVMIRCYILSSVLYEVLEEIKAA